MKPDKPEPSTRLAQTAALNPIAFLPFSKPSSALDHMFSDELEDEEDEKMTTHAPIMLGAAESLPYLQVFTPLVLQSTSVLVPGVEGEPRLQLHRVTATAAAGAGLFSARIELSVDTRTHAVQQLRVPRVQPAAAAGELDPLIRRIVADSPNTALTNNVAVLGWAMGEWVRLAVRRAKVWRRLETELGNDDAVRECAERARAGNAKPQKRKRRRPAAGGVDEDADEDDSLDNEATDTAELLPYMSRMSMDFRVPSSASGDVSTLRVQWRINFDDTGEGSSAITVLVGVPGKCK
jgi:hypothetical protein